MTRYAELGARTNFSFLEGASHPQELAGQARHLGIAALGIADRNTLAGVVRAHVAAKEQGLRFLPGCRLVFLDGTELIVFPRDRAAYGRLCRLLSMGKTERVERPDRVVAFPGTSLRPPNEGKKDKPIPKGETHLSFDQARLFGEGLIGLVPAPAAPDADFERRLADWVHRWPDRLYLAAAPLWRGDDRARLNRLAGIAQRADAPLVAWNAVLYHHPDRRPLQDVLTCIREGVTIDEAGFRLGANAERHLRAPAEMARLFRGHEDALARTMEIVEACRFSLDELAYVYPAEPVPPGWTPGRRLIRLTYHGVRTRWPDGAPRKIIATIAKELRLIRKRNYANYFLTVHDIVAWARAQKILCQGRGSAANSVICYCLGITAVDPTEQDVLIERFISEEREEPPDIDVDFEHERREEVMQYVYRRYGRDRAAIVATVIHYRPRSAIRDVGKALGLTEDITARLAGTVWGSWGDGIRQGDVDRAGLHQEDPRLALALQLAGELIQFPRHLSQHVGGFVLTQGPLVETVPVGNAAMADRTFIEWDKDDIDALRIMKVDVLALGMLTAIRRGFGMLRASYGIDLELATVPRELPRVYAMLQRADSLGVFQVESRAQMAMLPRLRPETFYDLVVQVAIVRPGPIQGKMVHPYLARRAERREVEAQGGTYRVDLPAPHPDHGPPTELHEVLDKTLGVPLFQEQAMRIAMVAARFTGDEANGLRRAMATFRNVGTIGKYEDMMVQGMIRRGYDPEFATNCFNQIKGFGEYGFPESHAASFAHLVYISSWMKCDFPEVFAAALLNSQPMGFYAPAQIVRDARAHGVEVRHPDVNASDWDCMLEPRPGQRRKAIRLGLRQIGGFREDWALAIMEARADISFTSLADLRRRAKLPSRALDLLAAADALGSFDLKRRQGQWAATGLARVAPAPLFEAAGLDEADGEAPLALPSLSAGEEVIGDYQAIRLSLKGHPVSFLRERLRQTGAIPAADLAKARDGRRVAVGGVVLVRQQPGTAKGVIFVTIEDETGVANLILWKSVFEAFRPIAMGARMLVVEGRLQRADGVTHIVAERLDDWTDALSSIADTSPRRQAPDLRRHPRDIRILPASRDFH
jgi:error-prone DNA polymerase